MKHFLRSVSYAAASIALVLAVFASGYYLGHGRTGFPLFDGEAVANEPVDLTEFWRAWRLIDEKYQPTGTSTAPTTEERIRGAIEGLLSSTGDPYTAYFPPKEKTRFEDALSGSLEGVGMELGEDKEGRLTVIAPLKGSPAAQAGIQPGDLILEVDGAEALNLDVSEAVSRIRGKAGTVVTLTLGREGEDDPIEVTITRARIRVPSVEADRLGGGVLKVSISSFTEDLGEQLKDELADAKASRGDKILIDLRGDPGGYLSGAIDVASWFLPAGEVIVRERSSGAPMEILRSKGYPLFEKPKIAILVDGGSASAAEIVAGALREQAGARLFGERTFGKGTVQEVVDLPGGSAVKITVAEWLTPRGHSISVSGLEPDVEVDDDPDTSADEVEKAAVDYLLGK